MPQMRAPILFADTSLPTASGGDGPLSGGVSQVINPWRWMSTMIGNQFSLFSINLGRSSAPEVESAILDEVGSYGRQMGRISEALEVLVSKLPRDQLAPGELAAIEDFTAQMREVRSIKARAAA